MFICMKINFIINFFLELLHFKESCNLIGQQHLGHNLRNFIRYGISGEISLTILVFILDYFQQKLMTKVFKKSKKPCFGAICGSFCPNLGKNKFSRKKGLCQLSNIPIIYIVQKIKKTNEPFLRKMPN